MWMFVCVSVHHFTINIAILITHTLAHISSLQSVQLHNIHLFPTNIIAISHFLVPFPSSLKQRWWRTKTRVRFDCTLKQTKCYTTEQYNPVLSNYLRSWIKYQTWEEANGLNVQRQSPQKMNVWNKVWMILDGCWCYAEFHTFYKYTFNPSNEKICQKYRQFTFYLQFNFEMMLHFCSANYILECKFVKRQQK